jgi:outer membrane protein, heavy metal efflux system
MKLLLTAAAVLLCGCVHYQARPLDPARGAETLATRRLDDAELGRFVTANSANPSPVWPPPSWDLSSLTLAALYFHPHLDVMRSRWAATEAGRRVAGERLNPSLSLAPGYNTTTRVPSPWMPVVALDIPIETAGKRGHRLVEAAALSEAARLSLASAAWGVRSAVRGNLIALQAARETESALEDQQLLHEDNVRLLGLQKDAGAISGFELTQARIAADAARLALREADRHAAEARFRLAEAVGVPGAALETLEISFDGLDDSPPEDVLAEARAQALVSRTDLLAALARYASNEAALQLEIARQYPDIHLGPGYQYDQGDDKWTLGIGFSLPLFGRNRGAIAGAEARRAEAAAEFNELQARVLAEVDVAQAGYRAALRLAVEAGTLLADLQTQEATARRVFELGEISRSDLVALELQRGAATLARIEAVTRARQARGALEDALERPLPASHDAWQRPPRAAAGERARR